MDELEIVQYHQMDGLYVFVNAVTYRSPHFHHEWELLWVLDAPLKVKCQKREFTLQPGDLALFPPRLPHEFLQAKGICTFLCLQFSPERLSLPTYIETDTICLNGRISPEFYDRTRRTMLEIAENYYRREPLYEALCLGQSAILLHNLLKHIPYRSLTHEEATSENQRNARLMRLTRFVEENHMHKIRLADFAEAENCSVSYLSHFIKNTMNQTFQDYVSSVRFSHACKLIAEGNHSMMSVSVAAGFSDYRYFSKTFQKIYGMTPAEYGRLTSKPYQEESYHIPSAHSQERFLTHAQCLGVLQLFRQQLQENA